MHFKQNTKAKQSVETNQHSKKTTHDTRSRNATNEKKNQFLTFEKKGFEMWFFFSLFFVYIKRSCCLHFDC